MSSKWGIQVQHRGECWLYTDSDKAIADVRRLEVVIQQWRERLAGLELLRDKTLAAHFTMLEREYAGKARKKRARPQPEG